MLRHFKNARAIHMAPLHKRLLVWWPIVKLDDEGELTSDEIGGAWLVSVRAAGDHEWLEPDVLNAIGDHMADGLSFAEAPTAWLHLPSAAGGS